MSIYTCYGHARGLCGHRHRSALEAWRCLEADRAACRSVGADSDRGVYLVDASGCLLDAERKPLRPAHDSGSGPVQISVEPRLVPVAIVQGGETALIEIERLGEAGSLEDARRMAIDAGYCVLDEHGLTEACDTDGRPLYLVEVKAVQKPARAAPRAAGRASVEAVEKGRAAARGTDLPRRE